MRLYLSSYGLGGAPEHILSLVAGNRRTAVIMNAQDFTLPERRMERLQREIGGLTELGLQPEELDLRSYFNRQDELKATLQQFGFIWVRGGNVFLLRRAFRQSGFDEILPGPLRADAIAYGGFSAGVCILTPSLKGIDLVDAKDGIPAGYDKEVIWDGLGLIDYAIAPHYRSDHPESEDISKYVDHLIENHALFKVLRDGEAIVVNGDSKLVVG